MTQLKRLAQAFPKSYRTLYEHHCRTKRSTPILHGGHVGPRQPIPCPRCVPSIGFRSISTSRVTFDKDAAQPIRSRASDEIIFAADQPADLPDRASKVFSTWQLSKSKKGIMRQFTFASFAKAWKFMSLVADECKVTKHHPSWSNLYNQVTIEWTTHKPEGLSIKYVEMAEFCDRTADDIGFKK